MHFYSVWKISFSFFHFSKLNYSIYLQNVLTRSLLGSVFLELDFVTLICGTLACFGSSFDCDRSTLRGTFAVLNSNIDFLKKKFLHYFQTNNQNNLRTSVLFARRLWKNIKFQLKIFRLKSEI